ncbi:MAG: Calx-beta domain-containing protein [Planctomycetota bacterium]
MKNSVKILLLVFFAGSGIAYPQRTYWPITQDCDYSDWAEVPGINDPIGDDNYGHHDIAEVKLANDDTSLYFYIRVDDGSGDQYGDWTAAEYLRIYIDVDNNPATGYLLGPAGQQIGVEYSVVSNRKATDPGAGCSASSLYLGAYPFGSATFLKNYGNGGVPATRILSGVNQIEQRILLADAGLSAGDTITYTVWASRNDTNPDCDWLNASQNYLISYETYANKPVPAHKSSVGKDVVLSWDAPGDVASPRYDVYLGTNANSVRDAGTASGEYKGTTTEITYDPNTLNVPIDYYWRVDVNDSGTMYKGCVWTFKTTVPAFPGAEGAGMWSVGGRGGDVYHVTNLNDSGPGSIRYGIENASGPRTIVFDVAGIIQLESPLTTITRPNLTIAGQTAPGEGITFTKDNIVLASSDIILRYIRGRSGDLAESDFDMIDAFRISTSSYGTARNIIADHISGSWAIDEAVEVTGPSDNVTVQWCHITEALHDSYHPKGPHSMGILLRPNIDSRITVHHNLLAHNNARNPRPGSYDYTTFVFDYRNNVMYNYGGTFAGYSGSNERTNMNYIGNYIVAGPNSYDDYVFHSADTYTSIYQNGNKADGNKNGVFDGVNTGWSMFSGSYTSVGSPFTLPYAEVATDSADTALQRVLTKAGCRLPSVDPVDIRVLNEVSNGTGAIINSPHDVGGWPAVYSIDPPYDQDGDSMPDYWENQYGLDTANHSDRNSDSDSDVYTNLEEYLNNTNPIGGTDPIVYISATDGRAYEEDQSPGEFTVHRTGDTSSALSVNYSVTGSATKDDDYIALSGSVTIPSGSSTATIPVIPVYDWQFAEGPEQVIVIIDTSIDYKVGLPRQALVVIENDEWMLLTYDDFESGWGNYTDGGDDCSRLYSPVYAHQGSYSIQIRDNSGDASSFWHTDGIDVSTRAFTQIKIDFWFRADLMESGDDFWVCYYDGATWHIVEDFVSGVDFNNAKFYHAVVYVTEANYTFPSDMKIKFQCDAGEDDDYVRIDEIKVSARGGFKQTDFNRDYYVDLRDFAIFAEGWLICTDPNNVSCENFLY